MKNAKPLCLVFTLVCLLAVRASAVNILTQHFDNNRSGANTNETTLVPTNVTVTVFGKLFTRAVVGGIYAQPLIVDQVPIDGGTNPVVYVVTGENNVYAFDATNTLSTNAYWSNLFGNPIPDGNVQPSSAVDPWIGAYGTPVIDTNSLTMFLVTEQLDTNGTYHVRLRALDITTGNERSGSGQDVTGTVAGVSFNAELEGQRAGLLLQNGLLYIAFASHGDQGAYHGWLFSYSTNLTQQAALLTTPTGSQGGIWMSGGGVVGDGTNIYAVTANGDFNANSGGSNYGQCFIGMNSNLNVQTYFAPADYATMNTYDLDLGSSGVMLIPGTRLLADAAKDGNLYLVNADSMGGYSSSGNACLQYFPITPGEVHAAPVTWNGPAGQLVYIWPSDENCMAFLLTNGTLNTIPAWESASSVPTNSEPGGQLSISANGTSNGILWAMTPLGGDAGPVPQPGIVRAFDATSGKEVWNTAQYPSDYPGYFAKNASPVVSNGRLYVPTFSGQLVVYGQVSTRTVPSSPLIPNGVYGIINRNSGLGLDVENAAITNGSNVQQWGCGCNPNQQWTVINVTNNTYNIIGVDSGLALDVDQDSLYNGALIHVWTALGIPSQEWTLASAGGGYYSVINLNSGLGLDVQNWSTSNGGQIQQYGYNNQANQQWAFQLIDQPAIPNGTYKIVNLNSQKVLDVANYGTTNGAYVQQYGYGGGSNQQWTVTYLGDSNYSIVGLQSGKALAIGGSSTNIGTGVQIWTNTGIPSQVWTLEVTGGGYYVLLNKNSGLALDVVGGSTANGAIVDEYTLNWTGAQQWSFQSP